MKQLGAFVGWLSGSLAGVTAVLYGAGFIATLAQIRLLGLDFDFASHDAFHYVARGGNVIPRALLGLIVPVALVMAVAAVATRTVAWLRRRRGQETDTPRGDGVPGRLGDALLLSGTAVVLAIGLGQALYPGLGVTGLLFRPLGELCGTFDGTFERALIRQDRADLDRAFFAVTFTAGVVLSLAWIGARRRLGQAGGRMVLLVYAAAAAVAVIAVPVAHGLYGLRTDLPVVAAAGKDGTPLYPDQDLRLLSHDARATLLWLPAGRQVLWLRAGTVDSLRVGAPTPLFATADGTCPAAGTP